MASAPEAATREPRSLDEREDRRAIVRWLLALLAAPLALVLAAQLAPLVPRPESALQMGAAAVLTFACVGLEVLVVAALAPALRPRALPLLLVPLSLLVTVALLGPALPRLAAAALVTVGLLGFGTFAGSVVGRAIEHAGYLIVVAAVSALVDVFSVLHPRGPTAQLVEIETAVNVLLLPWPILGTTRIDPVLGVGDVAFAAIYLAAGQRHGLPIGRTLLGLAAGLVVTLIVVMATGRGIPALPFLGLGVVLAHPEARRVPEKDRKTALAGLLGLAVLFGALFALR